MAYLPSARDTTLGKVRIAVGFFAECRLPSVTLDKYFAECNLSFAECKTLGKVWKSGSASLVVLQACDGPNQRDAPFSVFRRRWT